MEDLPFYGPAHPELPAHMRKRLSHLQALHLLIQMGWNYLTPEQVNRMRGRRMGEIILEDVLADHIRSRCRFTFKGRSHLFTENAVLSAVNRLKGFRVTGEIQQHEQIYDLLCLGTSVPQTIAGDTKSFTIDYMDWNNPAHNTFHCTTYLSVERHGGKSPPVSDIVLFVNGIPIVVIACSGADRNRTRRQTINSVIDRLVDAQANAGMARLFLFCQLLLALSPDMARYGTTGAPARLWSVWREADLDGPLRRTLGAPVEGRVMDALLAGPLGDPSVVYAFRSQQERKITAQDRAVFAMCRPERLMELAYKFILFDGGVKKIARYQQYFTVQQILKRVLRGNGQHPRSGGVVWHTQGSGKSLTMVMLTKSLVRHPEIQNPKVVLVTDRIDLDHRIRGALRSCGLIPEQASTGRNLADLLRDRRAHIVTTMIHKFSAAVSHHRLRQVGRNTFVLVDEGHRSHYSELHTRMNVALKNACFIAFTGTPLARSVKKNTFAQFGDLFRPPYTISQAVADEAVVPLLYEARHVPRFVDQPAVDQWFDNLTAGLGRQQQADLKQTFSRDVRLSRSLRKVRMIAWDVSIHFATTYQHTGLKGQLVAPDNETALRYKEILDDIGLVVSELLISPPAEIEQGHLPNSSDVELPFWQAVIDRFGSEKNYNRQLINAFKRSKDPEIIIVVDKLLTGFDASRNAVLYLARRLKDHTLLQAIGRVNRLHSGKAFGLIMDYSGVTRTLDQTMDFYGQLTAYDLADIESTVTSVADRTEKLHHIHADLRALFVRVKGPMDMESYAAHLRDNGRRNWFYNRFSAFARTLALAFSSTAFIRRTPEKTIRQYKSDLKFFHGLRAAAGRRFQEVVDTTRYASQVKKVMDTYVGALGVEPLCTPLNLLDVAQRTKLMADDSKSTGAKVDMLAAATRHMILREMTRDPLFYKKFSQVLNTIVAAYHSGRMDALTALGNLDEIATKVATHTDDDIPDELVGQDMARRYYGCVCEAMPSYTGRDPRAAGRIALRIADRLLLYKKRDWRSNPDAINKMRSEIDDILFDAVEETGIDFSLEDQDYIIDRCIEVTKAHGE